MVQVTKRGSKKQEAATSDYGGGDTFAVPEKPRRNVVGDHRCPQGR